MEAQELLVASEYKYGFSTPIETESFPPGLSEETIYAISQKKNEPSFLLEFRLNAYRKWLTMEEPDWANLRIPPIDFQAISYYSSPKRKQKLDSLDQVDPELLRTFEKLGVPIDEQKRLT